MSFAGRDGFASSLPESSGSSPVDFHVASAWRAISGIEPTGTKAVLGPVPRRVALFAGSHAVLAAVDSKSARGLPA